MFGSRSVFFFSLFAMAAILDGQTLDDLSGPTHGKVVVCYVATWAAYRPELGKFELDNLDPGLCTHLVYSFAGLDEHANIIKSLDPWQDLEKDYGKNGFKRLVALKQRYPHLKVTIAIGGWNEGSLKYSLMAEDPEKRSKFVKSVMLFLDMFKFDGLDLDWEYPARRDGRPIDKVNYVSLVKELKEAFEPKGYILTAALGAGKETMDAAYELSKLSRYLDFIHMMCYDYHGTWDGVVGANAPLTGLSEEDVLSIEYTIKYMLSHGVSPYKMVLGLPMYGRSFVLTDPSTKDIIFGKTPAQSQGFKGPYTREAGFLGYNEICMEMSNSSSKWTQHWDAGSQTPYLRDGSRVISYDNARSIAIKVKMAMDYELGGLMVWSIDTDDFLGRCQPESDPYVDFTERFQRIHKDPVMTVVLERLNLPDGTRREYLNRRSAYVLDNGVLNLRLPERQKTNYALMRTINEATSLAIEEKMILDEMHKVEKENEIDVTERAKPGAGVVTSASALTVVMSCVVLARNW
ncbi:probable chitinase 2 [Plutella xylostella]|uniref:probable chitinase 2 n=1 Tax=Plutella xylostella TaxID=51655 RepID=UPI00203296A3|nr:probable chitinase 2 [Plutella xylostella]